MYAYILYIMIFVVNILHIISIIYLMVFTLEGFLEFAIESLPEWESNP